MPRRRRVLPLVLLAILAAASASPGAAAHGDRAVADEAALAVPPGGAAAFPFEGHYHRLVGHVEPLAGPPVSLLVRRVPSGEVVWESGPVADARALNALVPCCRDDPGWADLQLVVANADSAQAATLRLHVKAVHDDLLVASLGVEGDILTTPFIMSLPALVLGIHVRRAWMSRGERKTRPPVRSRLVACGALAALAVGLFVAVGLWGAQRYGGGMSEGFVAAGGMLLPSFGAVALYLLVIAAWLAGVAAWFRAYREAIGRGGPERAAVVAVGLVQAVVVALLPVAIVAAHGAAALPMSAASLLPLAAVQSAAAVALARQRPTPPQLRWS